MTILGLPRTPLVLAAGYAATLIAGGALVATRSSRPEPEIYRRNKQAPFAPPSSAFGPAWTVIKLADAWAAARLATRATDERTAVPKSEGSVMFEEDIRFGDQVVGGPVVLDEHSRARRTALVAAALNDVLYVAFPLVYFRGRSPVLGAAVTTATAAVTLVQLEATRRVDGAAALALLPRTAWMALATPVALYQAAYNEDRLLGTDAPVS